MLIIRILLNPYFISGSPNQQSNPPSQDPRWRQGSSNPSRAANASGSTHTSHPNPPTDVASVPPRPATVAKDSGPRNAAPNYGFYRGSTLSSSMHIPSVQPGPSEPLKVTATKTSSKPSLASKSVGSTHGAGVGGSGSGGGRGTESLSQATPSRSRFQPVSSLQCIPRSKVLEINEFERLQHKIAGRPGDAPVSPASGRIVSMDSISRPGIATSVVGSKSLERHAPRGYLNSSSSAIPLSPAARGPHSVSLLNDITSIEVPNDAFFTLL